MATLLLHNRKKNRKFVAYKRIYPATVRNQDKTIKRKGKPMIDYFIHNLWQLWALISVICLILELTNGDFFIICFAIGAFCSAILSAFGCTFYAGLATFAVASVLSLFFIRPTLLKKLHKNEENRASNADALIGRTGRVSQKIERGGYGRVAIDGDDWKAVSQDGSEIDKDCKVKVVGRESIIITVEKA